MATNYVQSGKQMEIATATTLEAGAPFIQGTNRPCVLLTDAETASPYNATCAFEGVFDLSVAAVNDSGNTTISIGDAIYYTAGDTPKLSKKSSGYMFGVAQEANASSGSTSTINVAINPVYVPVGGVTNAMLSDDSIKQSKFNRRYTLEEFESNIVPSLLGGGVPTGATGTTNVFATEDSIFEYFVLGAGQTLLAPTIASGGLLASLDLTNNEGVEYSQGITARSRSAFVIGTDAAFFLKVGLTVADVSGSDICAVGFRKAAQAYQATFVDYTDKATLNKIAGDIYSSTALNNNADVDTDTTLNWADGETHTLEVYVSAAGVVTYKVDGAAATGAAFTFDDTDTVIPFVHLLHDVTAPGAVHITSWECGLQ